MNPKTYQAEYIGYIIDAWELARINDNISWQYLVEDIDGKEIFKLIFRMSFNYLATKAIKSEVASQYVRDEGLKRIRGRIILLEHKIGTEYEYQVYTTGEKIEPEEPHIEPPFRNDEEKARYYILKALKNIRLELLTNTFMNASVNVDDISSVVGVSINSGKAALGILNENKLIAGNEVPSTEQYGAFEFRTMYITNLGLAELDRLEAEILTRWRTYMPNLVENAFMVLGILYENKITSRTLALEVRAFEKLSGLNKDEFVQVLDYLRNSGFINRQIDASDEFIWLTPYGMAWFKSEKEKKIPIGIDAIRVTRYVFQKTQDGSKSFVPASEIAENLQLDESTYRKVCQELADRGLLEDKHVSDQLPFKAVSLTSTGRNAFRDGFIKTTSYGIQQNIGAIFEAPVSDSNIQAVALAAHSNISQAIDLGNDTDLRKEISGLLEQLVNQVEEELDVEQLSAYANVAKELNSEINKPKPNVNIIQRLLGILEFAGNVDGTIELGKKGIELAIKFAPLILALQQAIAGLLH